MIKEEKIKYYLDTFETLQRGDLNKLFALAQKKVLQVGDIYIPEGSLTNKLAYVTTGLIRLFGFKENGEEATLQLYWEDQFFASRDNVIFHKPSRFAYQALEPTELLEVDFDEMQNLLDQNPQFAPARNFFQLKMISDAMDRVESFILLTPEKRYLQLIKEKPDIIFRVTAKYIATILGITPVSLSWLRKRISQRGHH